MTDIKFLTITELDRNTFDIIAEVTRSKIQIVITKRGKPVARLRKIDKEDRGRKVTVTSLANSPHELISNIGKGGGPVIITKNNKAILFLKKIGAKAFTIEEG
jgi:prevent-host-death family protein